MSELGSVCKCCAVCAEVVQRVAQMREESRLTHSSSAEPDLQPYSAAKAEHELELQLVASGSKTLAKRHRRDVCSMAEEYIET